MKKTKITIIVACLMVVNILASVLSVSMPANALSENSEANTQVYVANDGTNHTIYWAQGITPPKMASDSKLKENKAGYFEYHEDTVIGQDPEKVRYVRYKYPIFDNINNTRGFYDLNKNPDRTEPEFINQESKQCYLAASVNLLHWWLDQNSAYIDEYLDNLQKGVYGQLEGLHPLLPYNEYMWQNYRKKPMAINTGSYISQDLSNDYLYATSFPEYLALNSGYVADMPIDNFINGYSAIDPNTAGDKEHFPSANKPENFKPSIHGGYFYPIFGKQKLTNRGTNNDYKFYKSMLKQALTSGKGVSISYQGPGQSHAITLWGAEYDSKGELVRIFITDSDDFDKQADVSKNGSLYGMSSYEIGCDYSGAMYITNSVGTQLASRSFITRYCTVDLGKDVWEEKLKDATDPIVPVFENELHDVAYAFNDKDIMPLEVVVKKQDTGEMLYQWYESDSISGVGNKIEGAVGKWYKPPKPTETGKYYYCEVVNHKNGKYSPKATTRRAKVYVDNNVTNAQKPSVSYNGQITRDITRYSILQPISVNASVFDGGTLSYQWYYKTGMDRSPSGGTMLLGETSSVFYPTVSAEAFDGEQHIFYCVVTNTNNTVNGKTKVSASPQTSVAITITKDASFTSALSPIIVKQPVSESYDNIQNIRPLSVKAKSADNGSLTYQWYLNGSKILGATESTYMPSIKASGTYNYYCEVTNTNNNASSNKTAKVQSESITITITGSSVLSDNNDLKQLTITGHTLNEIFNKDVLNYSLTIPYNVSELQVNAVAFDNKASVVINGERNLVVGLNTISIKVTAENGSEKTYTISVTRQDKPYIKSDNNNLSSLQVTGHTLSPTFSKNELNYSLVVGYDVSSLDIVVSTESDKASYEILGNNLVVGLNTISIKVTAENGSEKTYIISVTRQDKPYIKSDNNNLSAITINGIVIDGFASDKTIYNISFNSGESVDIKAAASDSKASVKIVNNNNLQVGTNEVKIVVTAENGSEKTYTINVTINKIISSQSEVNKKMPVWEQAVISVSVIVVVIAIIAVVVIKRKKL